VTETKTGTDPFGSAMIPKWLCVVCTRSSVTLAEPQAGWIKMPTPLSAA
jgi:hypothetical protein